MAAKSVLVILSVASELASPGTSALAEAARYALGAGSEVELTARIRRQSEVIKDEASEHAGIVWLRWEGQRHQRVQLRFYLPGTARWFDEEQEFRPDDPEWERGRTLGYLIASVVLEGAPRSRVDAAPPDSPPPADEGAADRGSEGRLRSKPDFQLSPRSVAAAASAAGPGPGTRFGGWLGAEHALGPQLALGGFAEAHFGRPSLPQADARSRAVSVGLSGVWYAYRPAPAWLAVRGSVGISHLRVERSVADETGEEAATTSRSRLGPQGELVLQLGHYFTPLVAVYAELGGQLMGRTELLVAAERQATLPFLLPVGRLGLKFSL